MPTCDECGDEYQTLRNACRYCNDQFCPQHRLPESHDCPGLADENFGTKHFESGFDTSVGERSETEATGEREGEPRPMKSVRTHGGSGKDRAKADFDSSPDVNVDGSIKEDETDSESVVNAESRGSYATWKILLVILLVAGGSLFLALAL